MKMARRSTVTISSFATNIVSSLFRKVAPCLQKIQSDGERLATVVPIFCAVRSLYSASPPIVALRCVALRRVALRCVSHPFTENCRCRSFHGSNIKHQTPNTKQLPLDCSFVRSFDLWTSIKQSFCYGNRANDMLCDRRDQGSTRTGHRRCTALFFSTIRNSSASTLPDYQSSMCPPVHPSNHSPIHPSIHLSATSLRLDACRSLWSYQ